MCLIQLDKCIEYSGSSYQSIGINQGMKQSEFNARIASLLNDLYPRSCGSTPIVKNDSDIALSSNVFKEYTSTKCQNEITTRTFKYSLSYTSAVQFTYDVTTFNSALPSGIILESVRVRITKDNSIIANLSGISSGLQLNLNETPCYAHIEARLNSQCGNIIATKSVLISPTNKEETLIFDISDSGAQYNLSNQSEFNSMIYSRLVKTESAAKEIELQELRSLLNSLQEELNILKTKVG